MSQEVIEITEREIEIIEVVERGPSGPTGPQANINYTVVSSPQTLSNSQNIAADTSGGTFTLTLPLNPNEGDSIDIFDYSETFNTNPLLIARNGERIESLEEDLIANVEGAYFTMIYAGSTRGWQIVPRFGTAGNGGGESTLTNQGDLLYRGELVNQRLPIGTAGQILKVNSTSTEPEWGAAPATGVTSVAISGANGLTVSGSPITSSGTISLTVDAAALRSHINVENGAQVNTVTSVNGQTGVVVIDRVENVVKNVRNTSGSTLPIGTAVRVVGATGENPNVQISNATSLGVPDRFNGDKNIVFGITTQSINNNAVGEILLKGTVKGVNTTAYDVGDFLFVPATGTTLVTVPPAKPAYQICVGLVVKKAADGEICINVVEPIHANDITGFNLDRATLANKQAIIYNGSTFINSLISYADLTNIPSSFTPSLHASTHHTGGTDAIAAHQINGQTIFSAGSATYSTDQTIGVSRAFQFTVSNTNASGINLTLPTGLDGTLNGDTQVIIGGFTVAGPITIRRVNLLSPLIYETLATITSAGQQFRFRSSGGNTGNWSLVPVDTHTHPASAITDFTTSAAAAAPVSSVAGRTGAISLAVADVANAVSDTDARLSDSRTPTSHASSHAAAGSDPLAPSDIGAQSIFAQTTIDNNTTPSPYQITASRAQTLRIFTSDDYTVRLPETGHAAGDIVDVFADTLSATKVITIERGIGSDSWFPVSTISVQNQKRRFVANGTGRSNWAEDRYFTTDGSLGAAPSDIPDPSAATPQALGTAAAGTSDDYSRGDHVHPVAGLPIEYVIACSDETSDLATGTAKVTFRAPVAFLLTAVAASVNTAPTGSTLIVDINNGANSTLSTKLSIDASEKTSATAASAAVIDTDYDDIAADAEITIDIDQIGSTIAGKGLKVVLKGARA
jgi:hypothetical protein